jgi:hypothetical protein
MRTENLAPPGNQHIFLWSLIYKNINFILISSGLMSGPRMAMRGSSWSTLLMMHAQHTEFWRLLEPLIGIVLH